MFDATSYIKQMVSPRDRRPGIMRGGILQIHLGRACTLACSHCTEGSNLTGKTYFMTPDQFEVACKSLQGYWGVFGCFGGQPTLSPYFPEICKIMQKYVPFQQRGLWTHDLNGHGKICRETFWPPVCNLNTHLSKEARDEMIRDWPECAPYVKGHDVDSLHSPGWVAIQDVIEDEEERWKRISVCDINRHWSAMIYVFRGELRGTFCELAGAQSILHQHEPEYPDNGLQVVPGWWNQPIQVFEKQIRYHCHACGIPLKAEGQLAMTGTVEQVSKTHLNIYNLKKPKGKTIQLITRTDQLGGTVKTATKYLPGEKEWNT